MGQICHVDIQVQISLHLRINLITEHMLQITIDSLIPLPWATACGIELKFV